MDTVRHRWPSRRPELPAWLLTLCVITVAFGVLHVSTGDVARGAVFVVTGMVCLVANVVLATRRSGSTGDPAWRQGFAGEGLDRYLMRWALVTGGAGAALSFPVLLNGSVASGSVSGLLLFATGLISSYLTLKILALWQTARSIPLLTARGEHISVMCSGRQAGIGGLFGAGAVLAATDRRLIVASTSRDARRAYRTLAYSELDKCEVGEGQLTLCGEGFTLAFTAVHPNCAQALAQAVENHGSH